MGEIKKCTVEFNVDGGERVMRLEYRLIKSGGFEYGNGTAVTIEEFNDEVPVPNRLLDTRYEKGVISDFEGWCVAFTNENYRTGGIPARVAQ